VNKNTKIVLACVAAIAIGGVAIARIKAHVTSITAQVKVYNKTGQTVSLSNLKGYNNSTISVDSKTIKPKGVGVITVKLSTSTTARGYAEGQASTPSWGDDPCRFTISLLGPSTNDIRVTTRSYCMTSPQDDIIVGTSS